MIRTESAEPLAPALIERSLGGGCHVWLRRNIASEQRENLDGDGTPVTVYTADEIYFHSPDLLTTAQVDERFAALWAEHVDDALTDRQRRR